MSEIGCAVDEGTCGTWISRPPLGTNVEDVKRRSTVSTIHPHRSPRQRWMLLSVFQHIPTLSPLQSTGCESHAAPAAPAAPAAFSAASGSLAALRLTGGTRIDVSLASA